MLRALAILALTMPASADTLYSSNGPFGGFFGLWGADVSTSQSVAQRFTCAIDADLSTASFWIMNNSSQPGARITVTIETDSGVGSASRPSGTAIESWTMDTMASGWNPVQQTVTSTLHPQLRAGTKYWFVLRSEASGGSSPVWNFASTGQGYTCLTLPDGTTWQASGLGAGLCMGVTGTPSPRADLDNDGDVDGGDLGILLTSWGACAGCAGDLNGDGQIDGADLGALLTAWSAGA
jgi:hypothetical protein